MCFSVGAKDPLLHGEVWVRMPSGLPWGNGVAAAVLQHFPITVVAASVGTAVATNYYNFSLPLESACGKAILEIAVPTKYNKETIEKAMGK